jgi:hypothetical protein
VIEVFPDKDEWNWRKRRGESNRTVESGGPFDSRTEAIEDAREQLEDEDRFVLLRENGDEVGELQRESAIARARAAFQGLTEEERKALLEDSDG